MGAIGAAWASDADIKSYRDVPSPRDWGANGRGNNDDTDAWQRAIDEVRRNPTYPRLGPGPTHAYVRAPAGVYVITRSLDFTTDGSLQGLGIRGDGQLQTVIQAELNEVYPALDMTGMSGAQLDGFQIRASSSSKLICNLLLAMDPNNHFHNRYPALRNLLLQIDQRAVSACAGLVIAASDLAMLDNVICDAPIGAIMGWRLPKLHRGRSRQGSDQATIRIDAGTYASTSSCDGFPIRIVSGAGKGQIRTITNYNEATNTATVNPPWETRPDGTSVYEISRVRSKYRLAQAHYDQTNYWIRNCQFIGRKGFVFTGGVAINFDDSYFACAQGGDADRSAFFIEDQDVQESPGPMRIHARGIRTENQTMEPQCYAITTAQSDVTLDISGELDVIPLGDATLASGAVLHNVGSGSFGSIKIDGQSPIVPLFSYDGNISSLWSTFRADFPGKVSGSIGLAVVDWGNHTRDSVWTQFLSEKATLALTPDGISIGTRSLVRLANVALSVPLGLPIVVSLIGREIAHRGATGIQGSHTFSVAGNLLSGTPHRRILRVEFGGLTNHDGHLWLYIRQKKPGFEKLLVDCEFKRETALVAHINVSCAPVGFVAGSLMMGGTVVPFASKLPKGDPSIDFTEGFSLEFDLESAQSAPIAIHSQGAFLC